MKEQKLFQLKLVNKAIGAGYFMNRRGVVFSERGGELRRINGSLVNGYTMYSFGGPFGPVRMSHLKLVDLVQAHKKWHELTAPVKRLSKDELEQQDRERVMRDLDELIERIA
jgi:hypothetical protein